MISVNLQVKHKAFGLGVITCINGKYITVRFADCEKNFVYPDVFEKFLTLADGTVSDEILADLAVAKDVKAKVQERKHMENVHSMTHGIVIPGKEISSDPEEDDNSFKSGDSDE